MWKIKFAPRALISTAIFFLGSAFPTPAQTAKAPAASPECSSFTDAKKHIGQKSCIRGQVLRVEYPSDGASYLNFCPDYRTCTFTVVVFAEDLHHVGSLEGLVGKTVEINGKIRDYDGRAEIVLHDPNQLGGEIRKLPPAPKEFDVEQRGKFSPGTFHASKNTKTRAKKAKLPTTLDVEDGFDD